jgi:hypothetical protein
MGFVSDVLGIVSRLLFAKDWLTDATNGFCRQSLIEKSPSLTQFIRSRFLGVSCFLK